jgi:hypothetical protein
MPSGKPVQQRSRRTHWWSNPVLLLALTAGLLSIVVQSGELGTADTMHRLQTAHSFWTSEPPVFPDEYPEFGIHGRNGEIWDWYGIGQPVLMLPFDIAGTYIERIPIFDDYNGNDPSVRDIFVTYCVNTLISVLTALICFRLLRLFGFTIRHSIAGVLALLFCTTHLHYTQNMMENNYIFLLTFIGFAFQYQWLRTGQRRALWIGSAALGLDLITRLTTGLDIMAAGTFLLLILWFEKAGKRTFWERAITYVKITAPAYLFFFAIDRAYQYYRFGSIFNTYVTIFGQEHRRLDPSLPAIYPFETPFHVGFFGPLFTPEKSIFLFDPLIVLTILLALLCWKRFRPEIKAYIVSSLLLVLGYICFYARYTVWSGDFAWGDRYVSSAVEMAALISVPLLLQYRRQLSGAVVALGYALIAVSAVIQLASLAFWLPLEIYQMETLGHPTFVIWLRFKNIAAFALGKMQAWGLNNEAMTQDPWDYVHITTWNFLPLLLKRVGVAPRWAVNVLTAMWAALTGLLAAVLWRLRTVLRVTHPDTAGQTLSAAS